MRLEAVNAGAPPSTAFQPGSESAPAKLESLMTPGSPVRFLPAPPEERPFVSGGLVALLDDVAALAKLAAASVDDIGAAAGRAGVKAVGVVIDDTAVTPRYVTGFTPERELPIIWRIAKGSLKNKILFILPAALLLSQFLPWALNPLLMLGGAYLCFEGAEKLYEAVWGHHEQASKRSSS